MKIKDLPESADMQQIPVKLPVDVYKRSSLPMYGLKNKPVYLQGWAMGDFFVKINPKSSQIYPMFWGETGVPAKYEEWEIITTEKKNGKQKK